MQLTNLIHSVQSALVVLAITVLSGLAAVSHADEEVPTIVAEIDVAVKTRDGDRIMVNIYRPNKAGRFPVIISMGPYGKDNLPAHYSGTFEDGRIYVSDQAAFETPDPEYWVNSGYVVIAADSPGSNSSEGDFGLLSAVEANAYYDVIEWAGVQDWSNGNVGLNGVSYFAMSQWYVAALEPPHLKAIMPIDGLTDLYRDLVFHGGIPNGFVKAWFEMRIVRAMNPKAKLIDDVIQGIVDHPFDDEYWQAKRPDVKSIKVPAYVMGSWPDHGLHTRGTLLGYERLPAGQKWLEVHGRKKWEYYYSRESLDRQRKFLDFFLKGDDNGFLETPKVQYEVRHSFYAGHRESADEWPLKNTQALQLFLHSKGVMGPQAATCQSSANYASSDEGGQLEYTYTFEKPTEITGGAKLKLWVSTDSGDDADFFVGLSKLDTNGNEVFMQGFGGAENAHLASGWLRASHRGLDADRSTELVPFLAHQEVQKLKVGQVVPVEIEIWPSSTFFAAGESLVLRISGTELQTAGRIFHGDRVNEGTHTVSVGGSFDSHLSVPLIRDEL